MKKIENNNTKKIFIEVKKIFAELKNKLRSQEFLDYVKRDEFNADDIEVVCNHFLNMIDNIQCVDDIMSFEDWCENGKIFEYDFEENNIDKLAVQRRIKVMNLLANDFNSIINKVNKVFEKNF